MISIFWRQKIKILAPKNQNIGAKIQIYGAEEVKMWRSIQISQTEFKLNKFLYH